MKQKENKTFNIKINTDKIFNVVFKKLDKIFEPDFKALRIKQEELSLAEENNKF